MNKVKNMNHCMLNIRGKEIYDGLQYVGDVVFVERTLLYDSWEYRDKAGMPVGEIVGVKGRDDTSGDFQSENPALDGCYIHRNVAYTKSGEEIGSFDTIAEAGAWIAFFHNKNNTENATEQSSEPDVGKSKNDGVIETLVDGYAQTKKIVNDDIEKYTQLYTSEILRERKQTTYKRIGWLTSNYHGERPGIIYTLKDEVKKGFKTETEAAVEAIKSIKAYVRLARCGQAQRKMSLNLMREDFGETGVKILDEIIDSNRSGPLQSTSWSVEAEINGGRKAVIHGLLHRIVGIIIVLFIGAMIMQVAYISKEHGFFLDPLVQLVKMILVNILAYVAAIPPTSYIIAILRSKFNLKALKIGDKNRQMNFSAMFITFMIWMFFATISYLCMKDIFIII